MSLLISLLFKTWLTDIETGYKIFPRKIFTQMHIKSFGFEFEPEITIKLLKKGYRIVEVPIRTVPRDYSQGKKLNTVTDGLRAFLTIIRYRLSD